VTQQASDVWNRYRYIFYNGHRDFVEKAATCEKYFIGSQWQDKDLQALNATRRPALTINKIIATLSYIAGEQIRNRTSIMFAPRSSDASDEVASALTKVFMQISDNNRLDWVRSDVFLDGLITSRGFFDVRLDFSDALRGEVRITQLNPRMVLIDPDAQDYDPDGWNDVMITTWMSKEQIKLLYDVDYDFALPTQPYDLTLYPEGFGQQWSTGWGPLPQSGRLRRIQVVEWQHKELTKQEFFVDTVTGDMRPVPRDWDRNRIAAYLAISPNVTTVKKLADRIRWTVVAGDVLLHDDWSPYSHFTVVPYFPYFIRGKTIGVVENLLGPQDLLNKVTSQELHVVNTSANSGWKIRAGALQNMSIAELEQRGAETGLVLELDDINNAEKITPNPIPPGLERLSMKAEEYIKSISGVSDYMLGIPREEASGKSILANRQSGFTLLLKVMDNLVRTDHILASRVLELVQEYYTEPRLIRITSDRVTGAVEEFMVNEPTPEGRILRDLTLGEYSVIVTLQPDKDTFESSQFEQALRLRLEAGVKIPDEYLIKTSMLRDKAELIQQLQQAQSGPQAELELRGMQAEVAAKEAEAMQKRADAELRYSKSLSHRVAAEAKAPEVEMAKMNLQHQFEKEKAASQHQLDLVKEKVKLQHQLDLARQKANLQQPPEL
jgi:hypothetical protein